MKRAWTLQFKHPTDPAMGTFTIIADGLKFSDARKKARDYAAKHCAEGLKLVAYIPGAERGKNVNDIRAKGGA